MSDSTMRSAARLPIYEHKTSTGEGLLDYSTGASLHNVHYATLLFPCESRSYVAQFT